MKISIITLQNISNYGSVLQAYATQVYFMERGFEVEFVDYWRENMIDRNIAKNLIETKQLKFKNIWGKNKYLKELATVLLEMKIRNRAKVFRKFVKEHLNITPEQYISISELRSNPPVADYYCAGSDQVWNSEWNGKFDEAFYLQYGSQGIKRFSFSSSFGVENIPRGESVKVKKILEEFNIITVRESSAVTLLDKLGIKADCILDPTLLIEKKQWKTVINSDIKKNGKYILVYQLNNNVKFDEIVEKAAEELSCKVIRIEYKKTNKYGAHIILPDITDWVSYFYFAEYIITDSFHATAFSINFEKKFVNILPDKYGTRILSILEKVNLEERKIDDASQINVLDKSIDYTNVKKKLENARKYVDKLFCGLDGYI